MRLARPNKQYGYGKKRKYNKNPNTSRTANVLSRTFFAPAKSVQTAVFNRESTMQIARMVQLSDLAHSNVVDTARSYSFQLSDLPNYTEFTNLFDSYRFDEVEVIFIPGITEMAVPTNATVLSAVDFDDAGAAASLSSMLQSENCELHTINQPIRIKLKPRFASAAFAGAFTSYANSSGWVDCASDTIQHYGLKMWFGVLSGALTGQTWRITARYKISFRCAR